MEFILRSGVHEDHDESWAIYSSLHECPVCLGCIVETIESTQLHAIQRKPALTELLRLLTYQSGDIIPLFMKEEMIVWHIGTILLENLKSVDDSYVSLCIEILLKMILVIGSEDLVTAILDDITNQVRNCTDHKTILPHCNFLGKMLYQLPALAPKLLLQYEDLLHPLSMHLSDSSDTVQSAIAYIFLFLCDLRTVKIAPRILHHIHCGVISMLSTVHTQSIPINGLGLLKKLITDTEGCHDLMSISRDGVTILTCIKKMLLSKKDVLQTGVCQILSLLVQKENISLYSAMIIDSNIVEFLFEVLHSENTLQLECIFKVLLKLSNEEHFYKRCHAVYGAESVLHALSTAQELKNVTLLKHGHTLLAAFLKRHPEDMPLFLSTSVVRKCLTIIQIDLQHHQDTISHLAIITFTAVIRRKHLLSPIPFNELTEMLSIVTTKIWNQFGGSNQTGIVRKTDNRCQQGIQVERYIELIVKCCQLGHECQTDLTACESNFSAPGSQVQCSALDTFIHVILQACDEVLYPLVMMYYEKTETPEVFTNCLQIICSLHDIDPTSTNEIVHKLVIAGFQNCVIDAKVKFSDKCLTESCKQFLHLVIDCCQSNCLFSTDWTPNSFVNMNCLNWCLNAFPKALSDQLLDTDVVQSYLLFFYISYRFDNQISKGEEMACLISGVFHRHITVEQLSEPSRKHFIYLLAYGCVNGDVDMRSAITNGINSLAAMLEGPKELWYTHDIVILRWCFSDCVLSATSGQSVVTAYLDNTNLESLEQICDPDNLVNCEAGRILLELCQSQTFTNCLLTCLATQSSDIVTKVLFLIETYIRSIIKTDHMETPTITVALANSQIDFHGQIAIADTDGNLLNLNSNLQHIQCMLEKVTDILHQVFLKYFTMSKDYNIMALIKVRLLLSKHAEMTSGSSVKILYHVLNLLARKDEVSADLAEASMLLVLAEISSRPQTDSQISLCTLVVKHEEMIAYIQQCVNRKHGNSLYCIACDMLVVFIKQTNVKMVGHIEIDIIQLVENVINEDNNVQLASLGLLAAMLHSSFTSSAVSCIGKINTNKYRILYIKLQQLCVQDITNVAVAAVDCIKYLIGHLMNTDKELASELLLQPWNTVLLDVTLNLAIANMTSRYVISLFSVFTNYDDGCQLIKSTVDMSEKLLKYLREISPNKYTDMPIHLQDLLQKMKTVFQNNITVASLKWLNDYTSSTTVTC